MPAILPSVTQRELGYDDRIQFGSFLGWNPDAGPFDRPPNAFEEMRNCRFEQGSADRPVTRRGTKEFSYAPSFTLLGHEFHANFWLVAKTEYAIWHADKATGEQADFRFDVSLEFDRALHLVALNFTDKIKYDGSQFQVGIAGFPEALTSISGAVMQYGQSLIITLFSHGVWIATPKQYPIDNQWNVEQLGKNLSPTPTKYDFPKTVVGPVSVFSPAIYDKNGSRYIDFTQSAVVGTEADIKATYYRADDPNITSAAAYPRWRVQLKDNKPNEPISRITHTQHRGWYYRFAIERTIDLPDGSKRKYVEHASVDIFVPEMGYTLYFRDPIPGSPGGVPLINAGNKNGINPIWRGASEVAAHPDKASGDALAKALIDYLQTTGVDPYAAIPNEFLFMAYYLGWNDGQASVLSYSDVNKRYNLIPPYEVWRGTHDIAKAPMAIFDWNDFPGIANDATVTAIHIFRTEYQGLDPAKRATDTPNFQPHKYGKVGTIEHGKTFTDDVKLPDFGSEPSEFDGYLKGQFAGDVIRDYGQAPALVLGNIYADYKVLPPSPLVQAFVFKPAAAVLTGDQQGFTGASLTVEFPQWFIAYEDNQGYRSDAVEIIPTYDKANYGLGDWLAFSFTLPEGYDPNIEKVILYCLRSGSLYEAGVSEATGEGQLDIRYTSVSEQKGVVAAAPPAGSTPRFYRPGAIIFSEPEQPYDWPARNIEVHHSSSPVRWLEVSMGELVIGTEESITMTQLRTDSPRSEEETQWIGAVGKHAMAKVGEAIVFLSEDGVYYMLPSGPVKLPGHADSVIRKYLEEQIPGVAPLANARRASMRYHGRRHELLLHFSSSKDLWPAGQEKNALRHDTIVYRFNRADVREPLNYAFDLTPAFEVKNRLLLPSGDVLSEVGSVTGQVVGGDLNFDDGSPITLAITPEIDIATYTSRRVIMGSGSDGSLWASYVSDDGRTLVTANLDDVATDYQGSAHLTLAITMKDLLVSKHLRLLVMKATVRGEVSITTGIAKPDGSWDADRGPIHNLARTWPIRTVRPDHPRSYRHPMQGVTLETEGKIVYIKIRTTPDDKQRHRMLLDALAVRLADSHDL